VTSPLRGVVDDATQPRSASTTADGGGRRCEGPGCPNPAPDRFRSITCQHRWHAADEKAARPTVVVLSPGLVQLDPALPDDIALPSPLATAWRHLDHALDHYIDRQLLAA